MSSAHEPGIDESFVTIPAGETGLEGILTVPQQPLGLVVFVHGSGSSRHSPRNAYVAQAFHRVRLATLLFDLLTEREAVERARVFDIELLADRLEAATAWLAEQQATQKLSLGYFGASTGAAAALVAVTQTTTPIKAIVSRGGRPDLAKEHLGQVTTPTLLIVGGRDAQVLELNQQALAQIKGERLLRVVPNATHLFEEPGALDDVITLAANWYSRYF